MTDPIITTGGADTWVNSAKPTEPYGDTNAMHVKSGERRGLVRPALPNILGRTVTSATLYLRAAAPLVAQEFSLVPATEHWTQRQTWQNQPAVDTGAYVYTTIGALDAGSLVAFNVTSHLQSVADGTAAYEGWRVGTNSTAAGQRFLTRDSGEPAWELHVTLAADAEEPANLRPDGGGAVSTAEPILAWDFDDQASYQVQVDTPLAGVDPDEVAPDYDSGWVTSPEPEHDLAAAVYTPPAGTAPTFWRVRVIDIDGNESDWSPWAEFTVTAMPTLVVDSPTGTVGDPRITVAAHLSTGTISSWEVWATGPDRSDVRWRSEVQSDATIAVTVPAKNADKRRIFKADEGGWLYLRVSDDVDRTTAVGEQTYLDTWIPIEFAANGTLVAPTSLTVVQPGGGVPQLIWSWAVTDVPDAVNIMVGDDIIETIDAADLTPVAGRYTWTDGGQVPPSRRHILGVAAVWGGEASTPATYYHDHAVKGVWLIPDADIDPIRLAGKTGPEASQSDRIATYTPVRGDDVDITYDHEGMRGTFRGGISTDTYADSDELWAALDRLEKLRKAKVRTARMVWGSKSITVRLRHPHSAPHSTYTEQNLRHAVSFEFVEVGD